MWISRLPVLPFAGMVSVVAPPAPWTWEAPRSALHHWMVTVWSVLNLTLLVIDTVAVAASPPSTSSVTSLPPESRRVNSNCATSSSTTVIANSAVVPAT